MPGLMEVWVERGAEAAISSKLTMNCWVQRPSLRHNLHKEEISDLAGGLVRGKLVVMIPALLMALTWNSAASAATYYQWQQNFSTDTTDWQGDVVHNATEGTATAGEGAYSKFGQYRSTFPGDYVAELDVNLDPSWTVGQGFEYSVASSNSSGGHLRDFVFHIASTVNGLRVNADNNVYGAGGNAYIAGQGTQITEAGWYTMRHTFRDNNGVLAVDLALLDSDGQTRLPPLARLHEPHRS
jgi:hypothetical protein